MEKPIRRKYPKEFQIQALNLAKELGSYSAAARQLGIRDNIIHTWKTKYKFDTGISNKDASAAVTETEEVKSLKKKIQELEKVNYILKKAAAFFSQDHLK